MSDQQSKEEAFMSADPYYYEGATSSSDANSGYSGSILSYDTDSSGGISLWSTDTTYGTFGSWTGGDTHNSGYEADTESLASTK